MMTGLVRATIAGTGCSVRDARLLVGGPMTMTKALHDHHAGGASAVTIVVHVGNVHWGSEKIGRAHV